MGEPNQLITFSSSGNTSQFGYESLGSNLWTLSTVMEDMAATQTACEQSTPEIHSVSRWNWTDWNLHDSNLSDVHAYTYGWGSHWFNFENVVDAMNTPGKQATTHVVIVQYGRQSIVFLFWVFRVANLGTNPKCKLITRLMNLEYDYEGLWHLNRLLYMSRCVGCMCFHVWLEMYC